MTTRPGATGSAVAAGAARAVKAAKTAGAVKATAAAGAAGAAKATAAAGAAGTAVRRIAAALAAVAVVQVASGCGRSAEQQEADALLHAIDVLRDAPSEPREARTFIDPNHGDDFDHNGDGDSDFMSTRVILDFTVSAIEQQNSTQPLNINILGLPEALNPDQINALIRIPTVVNVA